MSGSEEQKIEDIFADTSTDIINQAPLGASFSGPDKEGQLKSKEIIPKRKALAIIAFFTFFLLSAAGLFFYFNSSNRPVDTALASIKFDFSFLSKLFKFGEKQPLTCEKDFLKCPSGDNLLRLPPDCNFPECPKPADQITNIPSKGSGAEIINPDDDNFLKMLDSKRTADIARTRQELEKYYVIAGKYPEKLVSGKELKFPAGKPAFIFPSDAATGTDGYLYRSFKADAYALFYALALPGGNMNAGRKVSTRDISGANALDSDSDGLDDIEEKMYGTDPAKNDSDGDGYSDLSELETGHNPLKK
jgi:hypothetical protein